MQRIFEVFGFLVEFGTYQVGVLQELAKIGKIEEIIRSGQKIKFFGLLKIKKIAVKFCKPRQGLKFFIFDFFNFKFLLVS